MSLVNLLPGKRLVMGADSVSFVGNKWQDAFRKVIYWYEEESQETERAVKATYC
jgi:hypothetical protein